MVISTRRIVLGMAVFILAAPPSTAAAAEIKALITIGVQSAIADLAPKFEKANGHQITIVYGLSALLGKRVADGEPADLFIGTREGVDGLITRAIGYGAPAAGGAAGVHFAKVIERLGIVEEMKAKTKHPPAGGYTASMLVSGDVDLAVQQIPELIFVSGVELVGPLPSDLQATTVYAAGIPTSAKEPNVARALITFLRSPEAVTIIKAKGLDPG